jgi:Enterobacterial TraT complement resistance protein
MMIRAGPIGFVAAAILSAAALVGCAAGYTAIAKRDLAVETRMAETIFLDPVAPQDRTVFVEVRNTSDRQEFDIAPQVRESVAARGYRVVDDPGAAHYILQANVLQVAASARSAAESVYGTPFGGPLLGGAAGGSLGYVIGRSGGGSDLLLAAGGVLVGAAIEGISSAFVQDVVYTVVTDVQVSARAPGEAPVSQAETARLPQGSAGTIEQASAMTTDRKRYRTRVISTAQRANLDWPQAAPELVAGVTRSIVGIF